MAMTLAEYAATCRNPLREGILDAILRRPRHTWRDQVRVRGRFAGITRESCRQPTCMIHRDFINVAQI